VGTDLKGLPIAVGIANAKSLGREVGAGTIEIHIQRGDRHIWDKRGAQCPRVGVLQHTGDQTINQDGLRVDGGRRGGKGVDRGLNLSTNDRRAGRADTNRMANHTVAGNLLQLRTGVGCIIQEAVGEHQHQLVAISGESSDINGHIAQGLQNVHIRRLVVLEVGLMPVEGTHELRQDTRGSVDGGVHRTSVRTELVEQDTVTGGRAHGGLVARVRQRDVADPEAQLFNDGRETVGVAAVVASHGRRGVNENQDIGSGHVVVLVHTARGARRVPEAPHVGLASAVGRADRAWLVHTETVGGIALRLGLHVRQACIPVALGITGSALTRGTVLRAIVVLAHGGADVVVPEASTVGKAILFGCVTCAPAFHALIVTSCNTLHELAVGVGCAVTLEVRAAELVVRCARILAASRRRWALIPHTAVFHHTTCLVRAKVANILTALTLGVFIRIPDATVLITRAANLGLLVDAVAGTAVGRVLRLVPRALLLPCQASGVRREGAASDRAAGIGSRVP